LFADAGIQYTATFFKRTNTLNYFVSGKREEEKKERKKEEEKKNKRRRRDV